MRKMSNGNLFEKIKKLGFSEYEARCYLALLERKSLNVGEVARLAGIPKPNAYESLERLLSKGLTVSIPGKMKNYAAADPWFLKEKSLELLNNSMEAELENLEEKRREIHQRKKTIQEDIENVSNELDSLFSGNRYDDTPLDYIEILREPLQIHRRFMQLCTQATKEIIIFTKPPYASATAKQKDEQDHSQFEALKKGVKIRSIYEIPAEKPESVPFIDAIPDAVNHGEEARAFDDLPLKLAIFDAKTALFTLVDPVIGKPSVTSLVAEHLALAKSFKLLFESFWEKSKDYYIVNKRKFLLTAISKKKDKSKI
jgi:HTH-type transcriptional regulator, sugar sensing transcriptional regulator